MISFLLVQDTYWPNFLELSLFLSRGIDIFSTGLLGSFSKLTK